MSEMSGVSNTSAGEMGTRDAPASCLLPSVATPQTVW